ncbi:MAG TPA: extensin family protein [Vicinamibacterales bacterium]|nr:extensin family protein [Vicinamibacterales bacterium]
MPYVPDRGADEAGGLGCGPGCACTSCRSGDPLGEWYVPEGPDEDLNGSLGQAPTPIVEEPCPVGPSIARDRCGVPQPCPAVPNLICVRGIDGVPFEYVDRVTRDGATGLMVPAKRIVAHRQRFVPLVKQALQRFLTDMARNGLPVEAILTAGSLYCRCVTGTSTLSNHSFGDAIDIVGLRWATGRIPGRLRETVVHNFRDPVERAVLRRINAMLRLPFATVIDYHDRHHRDHFHCDMNRGRGRRPRGSSTIAFVQEALNVLTGRGLTEHGRVDPPTGQALVAFAGGNAGLLTDTRALNAALDDLFRRIAAGTGVNGTAPVRPAVTPPPPAPPPARRIDGPRILAGALRGGVSDVSQLTNVLFFARHPELAGRPIRPGETALAREWLLVRDRIVLPTLRARSGGK